jgi:hypothetical protein
MQPPPPYSLSPFLPQRPFSCSFYVRVIPCLWRAGVIILCCAFLGVGFLLMNTSLITRYRESFYRETASGTYKGALFPIAHFLIEIPWIIGLSLLVSLFCCFALLSIAFPSETHT